MPCMLRPQRPTARPTCSTGKGGSKTAVHRLHQEMVMNGSHVVWTIVGILLIVLLVIVLLHYVH
jgi:hypothetical protein